MTATSACDALHHGGDALHHRRDEILRYRVGVGLAGRRRVACVVVRDRDGDALHHDGGALHHDRDATAPRP